MIFCELQSFLQDSWRYHAYLLPFSRNTPKTAELLWFLAWMIRDNEMDFWTNWNKRLKHSLKSHTSISFTDTLWESFERAKKKRTKRRIRSKEAKTYESITIGFFRQILIWFLFQCFVINFIIIAFEFPNKWLAQFYFNYIFLLIFLYSMF